MRLFDLVLLHKRENYTNHLFFAVMSNPKRWSKTKKVTAC